VTALIQPGEATISVNPALGFSSIWSIVRHSNDLAENVVIGRVPITTKVHRSKARPANYCQATGSVGSKRPQKRLQ
jgi:hypothetical protein